MKIEVGKFYRTRAGIRARIYALDGNNEYPIHGAIQDGEFWHAEEWTAHGKWLAEDLGNLDLIEEWTEKPEVDWSAMPKWAEYVALDGDGPWCWYSREPMLKGFIWDYCEDSLVGIIPEIYNPKFEGGWRDSLVKRP